MRWMRSPSGSPAGGELGPRRRHPGVLRQHQPCVDDAVPGAPDRRPPCAPADSEMGEGRGHGGGGVDGSTEGTPQGAVISPLLANIYLHYVYDLWADQWRKREATGEAIVVRYADDTIVRFEREADAERFLRDLRERLAKFGLALHPDKTRLIEFGRYAAQRRSARGLGNRRPSTSSASRTSAGRRRKADGSLWCGTPSPSGCEPNSSRSRRR